MAHKFIPEMPEPPPEAFQDDKARLEWENKISDISSENALRMLRSWKYWALIILFMSIVMGITFTTLVMSE